MGFKYGKSHGTSPINGGFMEFHRDIYWENDGIIMIWMDLQVINVASPEKNGGFELEKASKHGRYSSAMFDYRRVYT
jgi:hypothetical protein